MKMQTYIITLEDTNGRTVNFERWSHKRLQTCIEKMVTLYQRMVTFDFVREELERTVRVVCYPTPDGYNKLAPVWSVTINEFRAMLEEEANP